MPQPQTVMTYTLAELEWHAQEKARNWYRAHYQPDEWWDHVYDDFENILTAFGITVATTPVPLMNGKYRNRPNIWFTGFASQGDGASFEGSYSYRRGMMAAVKEYAPKDKDLHRIAGEIIAAQRENFYQLYASIKHRGRYSHAYTMFVDVDRDSATRQGPTSAAEDLLTEAFRDLAHWLYRRLEQEYDYLVSDEQIDLGIGQLGITFRENGQPFHA